MHCCARLLHGKSLDFIRAKVAPPNLADVQRHVRCPPKQPPLRGAALDPRLRGGDEVRWGDEP